MKEKFGRFTSPDIQIYYKAVVIVTVWYLAKKPYNRMESSETDPHIYNLLQCRWRKSGCFPFISLSVWTYIYIITQKFPS